MNREMIQSRKHFCDLFLTLVVSYLSMSTEKSGVYVKWLELDPALHTKDIRHTIAVIPKNDCFRMSSGGQNVVLESPVTITR